LIARLAAAVVVSPAISSGGHTLLKTARSLCLFVNDDNLPAQALYQKAGYKLGGYYNTIYLQDRAQ